jgi:hypothetical protein
MTCCDFKVGDSVDWRNLNGRPQNRNWHGTIQEDLGHGTLGTRPGHVFEVHWTLSTNWNRFKRIPEGGWAVPVRNNHYQRELADELVGCTAGPPFHPTSLH